MNVYLSHSTALEFWRLWSNRHPLPLDRFHNPRTANIDPILIHRFPVSSTLQTCLTREDRVRKAIDAVTRNASPIDPATRECLAQTVNTPDRPLHLLAGANRGAKGTRAVARHFASTAFPEKSFAEIAPGLFICSPELVFLQMAREIPFGALLALGYELCGCYPVAPPSGAPLVRCPLTSPDRLRAFVDAAEGFKGAKIARAASRQIQARSASPMETELAIIAFTPVRRGGLGIEPAQLNAPVALSRRAAEATGLKRVVCDLLWPDASYAIEYDGYEAHRERHRQAHDSRKRDALSIDGIELITITSAQFHHVDQCARLLDSAARRMGKPKRKRRPEHVVKHLELRRQIRAFHRSRLFRAEAMSQTS